MGVNWSLREEVGLDAARHVDFVVEEETNPVESV